MSGLIAPWELHPALVHFPIAFLLAAAVLDLLGGHRREETARWATGLAVAGCATGAAAAIAGVVAWMTIPGHPEGAHSVMTWHAVVQSLALALFTVRGILGWRAPRRVPGMVPRVIGWLGAAALLVGSSLGGHLVFHQGIGVTVAEDANAGAHADHAHGGHAH